MKTMQHIRSTRNRCRADVLWTVVAFVLLDAGLAFSVHWWLPWLRDPLYAGRAGQFAERGQSTPHPLTIVMLGSSRTAYGFRGGVAETRLRETTGRPVVTCNLGCCGTAHLNELVFLKRMLSEGLRPDLLLVEVTPPMLAGQPYAPREVDWLPTWRFTWDELSSFGRCGADIREVRREWLKSLPLPWYTRRFQILSWLAPEWIPSQLRINCGPAGDVSGWDPHVVRDHSLAAYQRALARTRGEYQSFLSWFQIAPATASPLLDLLQLCRKEQVHTALVLMPEGSDFRMLYPPFAWPKVEEFLSVVRREFGVPVINAREWMPDAAFSDSHHLLPDGATLFTERLCRDVLVPLFQPH